MRFSQILSERDNAMVDQLLGVQEARAGGALSTRAASQAAGQSIGKNIAAGQISGDTQADIAAAKATVPAAPTSAAAPKLGDRLASYKAEKGASPTPAGGPNPTPAPAGTNANFAQPGYASQTTNAPVAATPTVKSQMPANMPATAKPAPAAP